MRNLWIKFGCFLTGFNYGIVRNSSEISAKAVKRYTAAMLIVCIIWAFVGYTFTNRYLDGGVYRSLVGSAVLVIVVIQIERQIILSVNPGRFLYASRGLIAIMMAIIGAIIIDQILFKDDIELAKRDLIEFRVNKELPSRTQQLRTQITSLDTAIQRKESERLQLIADVEKNPTIKTVSVQQSPTKVMLKRTDSSGTTYETEQIKSTTTIIQNQVPNPKQAIIPSVDETIAELRAQKSEKEKEELMIRPQVESEIREKVGFLDELQVMYQLIRSSNIAMFVWFIWFLFLFGLEMLVLISKANEKENDYERTVKHHMNLQIRKLDALARSAD